MDDNHVSLVGRLTAEPVLRFTKSGKPVANSRLAHNTRRKEGDEWVDGDTLYLDVTAWDRTAERLAAMPKGAPVRVVGKLTVENWKTDAGEDRSKVLITASYVDLAVNLAKDVESNAGQITLRWGGDGSGAPRRSFTREDALRTTQQIDEEYEGFWQEEDAF